MKRIILLTVFSGLFLSSQFLLNCSSPLDTSGGFTPSPPGQSETLYIFDTVFVTDTVSDSTVDTVFDTILVVDTVSDTIIDTLVVIEPDTACAVVLCSQISPCNKKIVWLFRNESGLFHLEFAASQRSEFRGRTLIVEISGQIYEWNIALDPEFLIDSQLPMHATIVIYPKVPPAYGHIIDVCVTVTKL